MTIKEFAKSIGVSPATVSRVVNGYETVNPELRQFVIAKMGEMGYRTNPTAKRLATGKAQAIAVEFKIDNPYSSLQAYEWLYHIQILLQRYDYHVLLAIKQRDEEPSPVSEWLRSRMADGIIFFGEGHLEDDVKMNGDDVLPPIVMASLTPKPNKDRMTNIVIDVSEGMTQAASLLYAYGHKNIGVIEFETIIKEVNANPFVEQCQSLGMTIKPEHYITVAHTIDGGAHAFEAIMTTKNPPTAIFARQDLLAIGSIYKATQMGIKVPEEVSIIGHDNIELSRWSNPPLTTIEVQADVLAEKMVAAIFNQIHEPENAPSNVHIPTRLVIRKSVGYLTR